MAKHRRKEKKNRPKRISISRQGQCCFCGSRNGLQLHHIVQKRFGGPDSKENLILICPECHKMYHRLSDLNLNHVLRNKNIHKHVIRDSYPAPIVGATPIPKTPIQEEVKKDIAPIYISGGDVTINFWTMSSVAL